MPVSFVTASARRRDWIGKTSIWAITCVSPMYGACRRGGEVVVVCMPMPEGHSQDRPSSTRGQSQHVEAKSKPSRVATAVTTPPSGEKLCYHADTQTILHHEDGGRKWKCVEEGDNEEREVMVFSHSLGRG